MVNASIEQELREYLEHMPIERQREVIDFARDLATKPPRKVAGKTLLRFAGTIESDDLLLMSKAIAEECERIETADW